MPPDPEPPEPPPEAPSTAEHVRQFMLGMGELGFGIADGGSSGPSAYSNSGESRPARTWYGRALQWTWAIFIGVAGAAAALFALFLAVGWIMSWFE